MKNPDWDAIQREVTRKIGYLRVAWKETSKTPEAHRLIVRDLYLPAMEHLAHFCMCVEEEEVEMGRVQ